jgi:RNA polymerase sigma-70 factor (ECF subfamily)
MSDADRFEAFVRSHERMVYATAVRLLGSPAEAEDVSQTVFLKAFERFRELGTSPAAAGWLKTVTRNACLNHLSRYRGRWQFFSELEGPSGTAPELEARMSVDPAVDVELERADQHERLERALQALPDHQRVPLVLYHFDEQSYQQIADALGVSLGKVKTDIHRGREALRRHITTTYESR